MTNEERYLNKLKEKASQWGVGDVEPELLTTAMMHPSYDAAGKRNNQRLEFLGDAVLGLAVADYLFAAYPEYHEGELTRTRALLAREQTLCHVAERLGLDEVILIGRGEEKDGGRHRASTLADAMEALIAAIYLDKGYGRAAEFVKTHFAGLEAEEDGGEVIDQKTLLQEYIQQQGKDNVSYRILAEEGPAHRRVFTAGVFYRHELLAQGSGQTKKAAEKCAAQAAYEKLVQASDHGSR